MRRPAKLILLGVGGLVALLFLGAAVASILLSRNIKPRFETIASQALGLDVTIAGRATVGFVPRLRVRLSDVHARKLGAEVASAHDVDIDVALLPLLRRQVRVDSVHFQRLKVDIVRGRDGHLNIERLPRTRERGTLREFGSLRVTDGVLTYRNEESDTVYSVAGCNAELNALRFADLAFAGSLACSKGRARDFAVSELKITAVGRDRVVTLDPVLMRLLGGKGSGKIIANYSAPDPGYEVDYQLAAFRIEEFFKTIARPSPASRSLGRGTAHFSTRFALRGSAAEALRRSASGHASLHGEDLVLEIGDLDKKFSRYETSQEFSLVDVGAFFFVGPLGVGITKGYDFTRILSREEGHTVVPVLVSRWRVEHGVAVATDVAMATKENRVAMRGGLDFVTGRYANVTVALIDTDGCARVEQKIKGTFGHPDVEQPNVLKTIAGPALKILEKAGEMLGAKCEPFYTGSVKPPK